MEFWKSLAKQLKAADFSEEYIQLLLKGFHYMPAEEFVQLSPGELAEAITAGWHDHHGDAGLGFMATPEDAADLLRIARQVLARVARQRRAPAEGALVQPVTLTINEGGSPPSAVTEKAMEFWKVLTKELKNIGFSAAQIKKLQAQFAHLSPTELLNTPADNLLPAITGRTVREKREKIDKLRAVAKEILDRSEDGQVTAVPKRQRSLVFFTLRLLEANTPDESGGEHFLAKVERLGKTDKPEALLFQGRADGNGEIRFRTALPARAGDPDQLHPKVKLQVLGLGGESVLEQILILDPKKPEIPVKVKLASYQKRVAVPLVDWQRVLGKTVPNQLADLLTQNKIATLADVRRNSGRLRKAPGLGRSEVAARDELLAHAHLQLVSRDHKLNQALIDAGFKAVFSIAAKSRAGFIRAMDGKLDEKKAIEIHEKTKAAVEVGNNRILERRAAQANGYAHTNTQTEDEPPPCTCDCQSAVSPLAYLADLLNFVCREITYGRKDLTPEKLETIFHQPFSSLPGDCSASEEVVRQVRLCIEVLRRKAAAENTDLSENAAIKEHPKSAYEALLAALGTSYRELRLLRGASEQDKERRAATLGITVGHLEKLLLGEGFFEADLEAMFGLQDTSRDPLCFGAKLNDPENQIWRWQLKGVKWRRNTDERGRVYAKLVKQGNTTKLTLSKHSSGAGIVGEAEKTQAGDEPVELTLSPLNSSGLSGQWVVQFSASGEYIEFAAIPEFLTWQLERLIQQWKAEDYPESSYDVSVTPRIPIVDPDLLTEEDFCRPLDSNEAHKLWKERKKELQTKYNKIDKDETDAKRTMIGMVGQVWPSNPPDWENITADLQSTDKELVQARVEELARRYLTPETFEFLNKMIQQEALSPPTGPGTGLPALSESEIARRDEERKAVLDILTNVIKRRDYYNPASDSSRIAWREDEEDKGISLSPKFLCLVPTEPELNPLRVSAGEREQWKSELQRNSQLPIIEPDIVPRVLTTGQAGDGQALILWVVRNDHLLEVLHQLQSVPLAGRTLDWLDDRLQVEPLQNEEDPPETLLHGLGLSNLDDLQQRFEESKPLGFYPQQHGLTRRELNALLTVRKLVQDGNADSQDWRHVFHILIQVEKRRYLLPEWRKEEADQSITLSPEFFIHPDQPLLEFAAQSTPAPEFLEWRSDPGTVRSWLSRLRARFQQQEAFTQGLRTAVDQAEEATLPTLRDALIEALYQGEQKKKDASNALLIDTFESGCRKLTRVSQAMETMQLLVWGIMNGQVEGLDFRLPAQNQEEFDATWHWLQSYAKWRAAMFVFMYPENYLLPRLRPGEEQTLLFKAIVKVLDGTAAPPRTDDSEGSEDSNVERSAEEEAIKQLTDRIFEILGHVSPSSEQGIRLIWEYLIQLRFFVDDVGGVWQWDDESQSWQPISPQYFEHRAFIEDILYLPLHIALTLQQSGDYAPALEWFRTVYDFNRSRMNSSVERVLTAQSSSSTRYYNSEAWLNDELNPHLLAETRLDVNLRFIQTSIVRCLLDYAEAEFSTDTPESLARARELYLTAQRMLELPELKQTLPDCDSSIGKLIIEVGEKSGPEAQDLFVGIIIDGNLQIDPALIPDFRGIDPVPDTGPSPLWNYRERVVKLVEKNFPLPTVVSLGQRIDDLSTKQAELLQLELSDQSIFNLVQELGDQQKFRNGASSPMYLRAPGRNNSFDDRYTPVPGYEDKGRVSPGIPGVLFEFCIPPNPVLIGLRLRAETGLFKLSNCMNLAGLHREVPAYAAPTDTHSGMPTIGMSGTITLPQVGGLQGTQYRYKALVERAKQLVGLAQQLEASYLSFLEKLDQEKYTILRARHELGLANANVTLQGLRVTEAENGQALALLQWQKAEDTRKHFNDLLTKDSLAENLELGALALQTGAAFTQLSVALLTGVIGLSAGGVFGAPSGPAAALAAASGGAAGLILGAMATGGQGLSTLSGAMSMAASFERRKEEWTFQRDLAEKDKDIADVQETLAEDHYNIVNQEETIAQISADNASDVLNFLDNKFTNAELYSWMSGIVGEIYRYFLEQSTAIAKLAQRQLAFERQEYGLDFILSNYWSVTSGSGFVVDGRDTEQDRRGMTGSARLLHDLYRMDQYAFTTDRRKLQMSKMLSLAMHDPIAFQQFRETGVLPFTTTRELFDRDFPGHYLRLIKRVRTTVVALIPPVHGIKATLSTTGISRVVVGSEAEGLFEERAIPRETEAVALTAPTGDSGLFELQEQPEMLLPFEGLGVANGWEFRLPKAANAFDFSTIADVLVTIEYTALDSPTYRQQVIEQLNPRISADRPFSFRHQFADAWYDLHHPELVQDPRQPMVVSFETRREDFPPHINDLQIEAVALYIARRADMTKEINIQHLHFTEPGATNRIPGDAATITVDGIASTRRGTASSWNAIIGRSPIGEWELALPEAEEFFKEDHIEDILFVITFGGRTPEWPAQ